MLEGSSDAVFSPPSGGVFKMLVDNHVFEAHSGFAPLCSLFFPAFHKKGSAIQPAAPGDRKQCMGSRFVTAMLRDLEVGVVFDPDCEHMYAFPSFRRIICK